jgi:hypothetical protein
MTEKGNPSPVEPGIRDVEEALRGLRRDEPPDGLALKITEGLRSLPLPQRPLRRRLAGFLARPAVTWSYRFATLLLLGGILWGIRDLVSLRREAAGLPGGPGGSVDLVSGAPQERSPVRVNFFFKAPEAMSVAVVGSFNDWDPGKNPMSRGPNGEWILQMDLLPGRYEYQFVVDGTKFVPDPNALEQKGDGIGSENAVLRL